MDKETPTLALFVYGTLKSGFPAHEGFFDEGIEAEEGFIRGSLFELAAGFPALAIPEEDILAVGTSDALSDAERQRGMNSVRRTHPSPEETVHGEIIRVREPERRLPALDAFEGFAPGGESLYRRVLIPAWAASGEASSVWAYAMESPSGARMPDGRWPPSGEETP